PGAVIECRLWGAGGAREVVGVRDGAPTGRHDQITDCDACRSRSAALFDTADQDAVPLREADRAAKPTRDVVRGDRHTKARAFDRLTLAERLDPSAKRRVRGQGQVEALADAVSIETDQPAFRVEQRPTGRPGTQWRRVLDDAGDPTPAGPTERPCDRRDEADRDSGPTAECRSGSEYGRADRRGIGRAPLHRSGARRVDSADRQVAVGVDAADLAAD